MEPVPSASVTPRSFVDVKVSFRNQWGVSGILSASEGSFPVSTILASIGASLTSKPFE